MLQEQKLIWKVAHRQDFSDHLSRMIMFHFSGANRISETVAI